jgi:hypothetical protein
MMRWLWLVLAWVGVVYLLSLGGQQASVNHHPHAGWNNSPTRSISISSKAPLQASTESTHSRAGPLESFVTPSGFLTTDDVDPPWLDYEGPVTYEAAIRRQRKPGADQLRHEIPAFQSDKKPGFCNSL